MAALVDVQRGVRDPFRDGLAVCHRCDVVVGAVATNVGVVMRCSRSVTSWPARARSCASRPVRWASVSSVGWVAANTSSSDAVLGVTGQPLRCPAPVRQDAGSSPLFGRRQVGQLLQRVRRETRPRRGCASSARRSIRSGPCHGHLLGHHAAEAEAAEVAPVPADVVQEAGHVGGQVGHRVPGVPQRAPPSPVG